MRRLPTLVLSLLGATALQADGPKPDAFRAEVDPGVPSYQATRKLSGELKVAGHDEALSEIVKLWADAFMKLHPGLKVSVDLIPVAHARQGMRDMESGAPPLTSGSLRFGPKGWTVSSDALARFEREHGYRPLEVRVGLGGYDIRGKPHAIAIWVNDQNPLERLTLAQVDAIFSKTRRRGYKQDITKWGDVGLTGDWANQPINIYGKNLNNTITAFFHQEVLLKDGVLKDTLRDQLDSTAVVKAVEGDRLGIAFAGFGFRRAGVKALALAENDRGPFVEPLAASVASASYPLSRDPYMVFDRPPGAAVDSRVAEFLKFVLSREGQTTLAREGLLPLPARLLKKESAKLG